jgi:hypothetical protein
LADPFGPDFSQIPFSLAHFLQRLLTSLGRYGISILKKIQIVIGSKAVDLFATSDGSDKDLAPKSPVWGLGSTEL